MEENKSSAIERLDQFVSECHAVLTPEKAIEVFLIALAPFKRDLVNFGRVYITVPVSACELAASLLAEHGLNVVPATDYVPKCGLVTVVVSLVR